MAPLQPERWLSTTGQVAQNSPLYSLRALHIEEGNIIMYFQLSTIEQSEENKEFNELCEFLNHLPEDMNMKWQLNASQEHYVGVINVI